MHYTIKNIPIIFFIMTFCFFSYSTEIASQSDQQKKIKVLFILTKFPEDASTAILNQMTGLIDKGVDLYIYAKQRGRLAWTHPDIKKYNLFKRAFYGSRTLCGLPSDLESYDIICCQFGYRGYDFVPVMQQRNLKAKVITFFRGSDLSKHIASPSDKYDELFKIGDLFLPVCDYFKEKLIEIGCDPKKIIVHHSAIDCEKFFFKKRSYDAHTIRLITVARLTEKKGLDDAIKAVAALIKVCPDKHITYTIVGFGPQKDELQQLIKRLGVEKNIILFGRAEQDVVLSLLHKSHIFIHPSKKDHKGSQEGIPNSLKEAMATGMPVISTYHAGIPELVEDGVSGLLIDESDIKKLAYSIFYLINHPDIWEKMGKAARKKVEQEYDTHKLNEKLFTLFSSLV